MPTGTVDFITSTAPAATAGMASITACTRERSASPETVGGVSTQTKASAARSNSTSRSVVKRSRSRFAVTSSVSPGSWIGTTPRFSSATFSWSMSRQMTCRPRAAKHAAVTSPT